MMDFFYSALQLTQHLCYPGV